MFAPARQNSSRAQSSITRSIPAPVGGINARDALADMDEKDAIILDNMFPEEGNVALRGGHTEYATGLTNQVETLMVWNGPTSSKMFAANDGDIFETSVSGAVGAADVTGQTNDRLSSVNFSTSGGNFLVAANGADDVLNYDGSAWTTPTINNVASADLKHPISHKERLWFIKKNSMDAWYLDTQAIAGDATKFPLGSVFRQGGYLLGMGTLSLDSGIGPDDFMAFVSSEGEIAIYQGTDPASASTWGIVGRYKVGKPIGERPLTNMGGDLLCMTRDGVVSVSKMMQKDPAEAQYAAVSNKISNLINSDAKNYANLFGWSLHLYPRGKWLLVNVPKSEGAEQIQYVMNVNTGSWCRFLGLNANCWTVFNDRIYFGGNDGKVYRADDGTDDNGADIPFEGKGAFQYFGARGRQKQFTAIRALISSTGVPSFLIGIDVDYGNQTPTGTVSAPSSTTMTWGSMFWGSMFWGGAENIIKYFKTVFGIGICAAPHFKGVCNGQTCAVNSFDFVMQAGGPF